MSRASDTPSKEARWDSIVAGLNAAPARRIQDLARDLNVSVETIRRDLAELEGRGLLSRTYGGAVRALAPEPAARERDLMMVSERERIAVAAARMIAPGDVVMFGGGVTTLRVARQLAARGPAVTAITHSLDIVTVLGGNPQIAVRCAPGRYDAEERILVGAETVANLRDYAANCAILGASGIDERGMSNAEPEAAAVYAEMMARAERAIVVADRSKHGVRALKLYGRWRENVTLVTDRAPGSRLAQAIVDAGAKVVVTP